MHVSSFKLYTPQYFFSTESSSIHVFLRKQSQSYKQNNQEKSEIKKHLHLQQKAKRFHTIPKQYGPPLSYTTTPDIFKEKE